MALLRAARKDEVPTGTIREFQVDGKTLAISNIEGKFYAISNTCLHRAGPLGQGVISGQVVTCPWHGWQYDVTTGKVSANPAIAVSCFPVEVRGEDVWVDCG